MLAKFITFEYRRFTVLPLETEADEKRVINEKETEILSYQLQILLNYICHMITDDTTFNLICWNFGNSCVIKKFSNKSDFAEHSTTAVHMILNHKT